MGTSVVSTETAPADRVWIDSTPPDLTYLTGFSNEDLECNREGRLSGNQQVELRGAVRAKVFEVGALLAYAIFGFAVFHVTVMPLVTCVVLLFYLLRLLERVTELRQGVPSEVAGDAWPEVVPDSEGPDRYWLHIDGLRLEISKAAYASFRRGGPYRVYYVASTNTAIGGEVLADWRSLPSPEKSGRHWWSHFSIGDA
ncbi:MAG TPA: hypothetical protein VN973_01810 [Candidatus Dormibacteraeota bacterium]|nr:hypothetical protein [Candidatus Dormibacteraeota bacterium]